ncbi:hypothetical protein SLA2020_459920, partial [Shorea laevis]
RVGSGFYNDGSGGYVRRGKGGSRSCCRHRGVVLGVLEVGWLRI